ncbi:MAG: hypothetical protein JXA25_19970 [Anaerolineales bacterium]|nr:hypothetical protein [Anaerolineales bacterium]
MKNNQDSNTRNTDQPAYSQQIVSIKPAVVVRILGVAAVLLVLISAVLQLFYQLGSRTGLEWLVNYFDVNREANIPTFYAVALLLFAAQLLLLIAMLETKRKAFHPWMWGVLAAGFLLLAVDELASFHEKLTYYVRVALNVKAMGILYLYGWVVPGIIVVLAAGFFFLRFWLRLPEKTRIYIAVAAVLYVGGAIGMEVASGSYLAAAGTEDLTYNMISTVEESLELAGVILFIHTLMGYIADMYGGVRVQMVEERKEISDPS